MKVQLVLLPCLVLVACGSGEPSASVALSSNVAKTNGGERQASADDPRALPKSASFADLVDAARALDDQSHTQGKSGCLLRGSEEFRLEADVLAGVRPLPSVPDTLTKALEENAEPPSLLSAWGGLDANPLSDLSVVAFTTTTPRALRARTFVAFLTKQGVYLRGDDPALRADPKPIGIDAFGARLAALAPDQKPTLYVTSEAAIPLSMLRRALLAVPARYEVGLAVALPKGTKLPEPPKAGAEALCPDGLPVPADGEAEGNLDSTQLREALAPLRDAALECAMSSGGRALLGGKLVLALRVDETGHASQACLRQDAVGDTRLRQCLLASARGLAFPVPSPKGSVDVELPLDLTLIGPEPQHPLCD